MYVRKPACARAWRARARSARSASPPLTPRRRLVIPLAPLQLREQRASIGGLVDGVVGEYYSGFTRSIQNYSHTLRLFTDSKAEARPQLPSSSRLQQPPLCSICLHATPEAALLRPCCSLLCLHQLPARPPHLLPCAV
jgi:hypothetical protein